MVVEGVSYEINWPRFRRKASIFIPALNPQKAWVHEVRPVFTRLQMDVVAKPVIEGGVRGLRVWRV